MTRSQIRSEQDMLMDVVRLQGPPADIDLGNGFVGAKQPISRYSRYGPFQGKWVTLPLDKQFAWEVSTEPCVVCDTGSDKGHR